MAGTGVAMVPAEKVVHSGITVIVPTLSRPSLADAKKSLDSQSLKADSILYMDGPGDPVSKIKRALEKTETEYVAFADDDAVYPEHWLQSMLDVIETDSNIGFVGGTMLPMSQIKPAGDSEKLIAFVLGSFFGTTNMSQRVKIKEKVEARDETNMVGCGLARTSLVKELFATDNIIPSFHDTWMIFKMQQKGYRTMYSPNAYFYHATRKSLWGFAWQMLRCGSGRMGFFKQNPSQAVKKFYILIPLVFDIYLFAFFVFNYFNILTISGLPLIAYVLLNLAVTVLQKGSWKLSLYYFVMHFSYGLGELLGLVRSVKKWS